MPTATAIPATPDETRRTQVAIVGAGIGGLAAARALRRAGVEDLQVFELADAAGGNARGHAIGELACPLGAHYLPVPGPDNEALREFLVDCGLARLEQGHFRVDERHRVHSPQERLFHQGEWIEGLLPPVDSGSEAERQMQRFSREVAGLRQRARFRLPSPAAGWGPDLAELDAQTFAHWLDRQGYTAPELRGYLDYVCRDDYGASSRRVSAWAGLHYFASRHGFEAPGDGHGSDHDPDQDGVLTWPEGNARLVQALAAPLGERLRTAQLVRAVREEGQGVSLDVWDLRRQRLTRWQARQAVLAVPLFIAARLVERTSAASAALAAAARGARYAPWLVANLELATPLLERLGAPAAWDNVLHGGASLGYVDAGHQRLAQARPQDAPRVLTAYWALGGDDEAGDRNQRRDLLTSDWRRWAQRVVDELSPAHPDLPAKLRRIDLARHGHAMSIPTPGRRSDPALAALRAQRGRLRFAHADLVGYSVFEEAFALGEQAGRL